MIISELFYSVQGEGSLVGVPSFFIRTTYCNLRCTWCDTPYTSWQPQGREMSIDQILGAVRETPARHVVVTGGEPMIAPEVVGLTHRLRDAGLHVTIETAGTVDKPVWADLLSISPKLANSTPHEREAGRWAAQHDRLRYQPQILCQLLSRYLYQLKFVVTRPEDLGEIQQLIEETGADSQRVVLMPEGTSAETLQERALWLVDLCKRYGYRFSPRLHVDLWGNRRGV